MGFNIDLTNKNGGFNGIYPLGNIEKAMESWPFVDDYIIIS